MKSAADIDDFRQIKRWLFGAVGMTMIVAAVVAGISNQHFFNRAQNAEGTVIKLNAGGSHPEIRFTTRNGVEIEYPQGGLIFGYRVNDRVTVYYDASHPRDCTINSFGALWGFELTGLILGLCFIGIALFSKSGD